MTAIRTFGAAALLAAIAVVALNVWSAFDLPRATTSLEQMQRTGANLQGLNPHALQQALSLQIVLTSGLAMLFLVAALGVLSLRRWSRRLFFGAGVLLVLYFASGVEGSPLPQRMAYVLLSVASLLFSWWLLFRYGVAVRIFENAARPEIRRA